MSIRSRLLTRSFRLLYGPLQFLHEPAGRCLFGASWHGRRLESLTSLPQSGCLLDVGCGSGLLLSKVTPGRAGAIGIDPSRAMLRRARERGLLVVAGRANRLPFSDGMFEAIVSTYPGSWILDDGTWQEFARVLVPGGSVAILLGGTVERGRFGMLRAAISRLAYGRRSMDVDAMQLTGPGNAGFVGAVTAREDRWGTVWRWEGQLL